MPRPAAVAPHFCTDSIGGGGGGASLALLEQLAQCCPNVRRLAVVGPVFTTEAAAYAAGGRAGGNASGSDGANGITATAAWFRQLLDVVVSAHALAVAGLCRLLGVGAAAGADCRARLRL
jgi:hypothetical protein